MSHITLRETTKDQNILASDLAAFITAVVRCGLTFKQDQRQFYNWATATGRLVGDWPLPEGFTSEADLQAACRHAVGIPISAQKSATDKYEIGLIASKKFPGTFCLAYDFFGGGIDRFATTGPNTNGEHGLNKLRMYNQAEVIKATARRRGHLFAETVLPDGTLDVSVTTP